MLGIVIPYFKIGFFEETLQSLANQTDKRFKVYIGDDASLDSPKALLETYKGQFDFVYHRFEKNLGGSQLVKQWERCMGLVGNENWFMVLGDDDVLGPDCVAAFYRSLPEINDAQVQVVRFATQVINDIGAVVSDTFYHPVLEKATDFFYRRFTNKTRSSLSEYIFSKNAYQTIGFYNYNLGWFTDDRAWLEFSKFGLIYSINDATVFFRLSAQNISRDHYKLQEKTLERLRFFKFIISKHILKFTKQQQRHLTLHYEQLVYKYGKATFSFWVLVFWTFFKQLNVVQCVKFTRRMYIHLKQHGQ
ncbi:glycosyltransferase [Flavobacteriaceae bacterium XHP0103]|uniref:glycosyltransferase family 2 protein n=1 Tax=Marixanthotalea marina TaxID=2844359 RepID=UPI00298A0369|nr:glycosyltransferase [Marixanthotalea marina]MBU3822742.1 glycosyltransferase [Marixanthotalea marina]